MFLPTFVAAAPTEITTVAETRPASPDDLRRGARLELGLASPLGFGGATLWRDFTPQFRLEAGIGMGLSGVQLSTLARALLGSPNHRFVPAAGFSVGIPTSDVYLMGPFHDGVTHEVVVVPFLNVDVLGYEYKSDDGWTVLMALGATTPLRTVSWFGGVARPFVSWAPETHIAFGKAF
jgi:hypothetical protein